MLKKNPTAPTRPLTYFVITSPRNRAIAQALHLALYSKFGADCITDCSFCLGFSNDEESIPVTQQLIDKITKEFETILVGHPAPSINIQSHDIIRYPGLIDLLKVAKKHKKKVSIWSPGISLADEKIVAQLAAFDIDLYVTFLSSKEPTFSKMTGVKNVTALYHKALRNLEKYKLPYELSIVITKDNAPDIAYTITRLTEQFSLRSISLRMFVPKEKVTEENLQRYKDYFQQIPGLETVNHELLQLGATLKTPVEIALFDFPPCQLDPAVLAVPSIGRLRIHNAAIVDNIITYTKQCKKCLWRTNCVSISGLYQKKFKVRTIDIDRTNELVQTLAASQQSAVQTSGQEELDLVLKGGKPFPYSAFQDMLKDIDILYGRSGKSRSMSRLNEIAVDNGNDPYTLVRSSGNSYAVIKDGVRTQFDPEDTKTREAYALRLKGPFSALLSQLGKLDLLCVTIDKDAHILQMIPDRAEQARYYARIPGYYLSYYSTSPEGLIPNELLLKEYIEVLAGMMKKKHIARKRGHQAAPSQKA